MKPRAKTADVFQARTGLTLYVTVAAAFALFVTTLPNSSSASTEAQNADDLLVVDCLLPGKVRRLGRRTTYVTARKAVKTTASECAIRGGEYTQADRASYATAIKIWLPLANEGDPIAQTYVGEIYEKGLGVPPEYALAVKWYRKAAEQGHARAQLNLGAMYEKGLGVPKDQKEAVSWYRRASGLEGNAVPYVPAETAAELQRLREEKERLQREKEKLEKERNALRQQLKDNRKQLNEAQSQFQKSVKNADAARQALAASQKQLEADVKAGRQDRILEISKDLAARSAELAKREEEAARLREQVASLGRESASLQSALQEERSGRDAEVERYKAEAAAARAEADQVTQQLQKAERASATQRRRAEQKLGEVAALEAKLAAERKRVRSEKAKEASLKEQLEARQRALAAERDKAVALESEAAALKRDSARLQRERAERAAAEAEIAALQADLVRQRQSADRDKVREADLQGRLDAQQRTLAAAQQKSASLESRAAALEERARRLDAERAKRADAERKLAALQKEVARRENDAAKTRAREARLKKQLAEQQSALAAVREKAEALKQQAARLQKEKAAREAAAAQLAASAPSIEIIEPQLPRTRTAGLPTVSAQGGDTKMIVGRVQAPVGVMALTINDVEQTVSEDGMFRTKVPLPNAENKVTVVAVDAKGRRIETAFLITRPAGTVRSGSGDAPQLAAEKLDVDFGTFHAVVIGINAYSMLPKLQTAADDARAVAELLETRYGHKVTLIINANRYAILSALNKLRETLTEDDNLLIYYAGHGELDRVNNRGHWLPVDAEPDSSANWISNIQITDVLNAMSVRQVLVVADSCYSGTLTRSAVAKLDSGMNDKTRDNWIKLMAEKRARVVLSSGGVQPVLDSGGGAHSVFARAFLGVLSDNSGILEGQRLFRRISQRVTSVRAAAEIEQVPQYAPIKFAGHEAGDFFFVPSAN